ncbi:MAG: AsmA family protein [Schleiferiaceae bacterium]|nr:AsmA family protein [Schleiferiaceae bacterium]
MKRALIFIGYFALILMLVVAGGAGYLYYNQDKIISGGISKLNEQLKAPVEVSTIELDLFSGFPRVRIVLNAVTIADPFGNQKPLVKAEKVGLGMNVLEVIRGTYTIEELAVSTGEIHLTRSSRGDNWDLLNTTDSSNADINLRYFEAFDVNVTYDNVFDKSYYSSSINTLYASGLIGNRTELSLKVDLAATNATLAGEIFLVNAPIAGSIELIIDQEWALSTSDLTLDGARINLDLNQDGGKISAVQTDIPKALSYVPLFEIPDEIEINGLRADWGWAGTWDQWVLDFDTKNTTLNYNGIAVPSLSCKGQWRWGAVPELSIPSLALETNTGEITGTLELKGNAPTLYTHLEGGSNLSELFDFIETDLLVNPMGFWKGDHISLTQGFRSWEDFTPVGSPIFKGDISLFEGAFALAGSNISFEKVEAELGIDGRNVQIDRCFLQSGENTAVVTGTIYNALEASGYPKVVLSLESPTISIDPLLYWEFEDDELDEETSFDYSVAVKVDHVKLGDFNGANLVGTVYNRGNWIIGDAMRIDGCDGTLGGNWALYEVGSDNVLKGDVFVQSIKLDQLLASFNSFDIEDLNASNLLGEASATATVSLAFDSEWEQHSTKTDIKGEGAIKGGTLQNYAPLQELSAFIDKGELDKIEFPYLASTFRVHGDTLLLPEMEVKNSALNLWVNGWQNLETDDLRYSVRLGLKDLAMRGKNSNRDLGNWIGEAENENQPYVRLIVGCNLDDVCISLDRERINRSFKEALQQEREDLKNIFKKPEESTTEPTPGSGTFELLWPEQDSLEVRFTH